MAQTKILEVKNLKKNFGSKTIHKNLSFDLYKSEILGLLGHSGTGKSVLLRCLIGLETMTEGQIYFNQERIDLWEEEQLYTLRTQLSYAFQGGALFDSLTVYENLAYPLREHRQFSAHEEEKIIDDALSLVHLKEFPHLYPSDLSGGMLKRAGLARSMILRPQVILYDEPTAGLDPKNVENILDIMNQFKAQGIGGLFVTHDISAAKKVCDRVMILHQGQIGFMGTFEEFENSPLELVKNFRLDPY